MNIKTQQFIRSDDSLLLYDFKDKFLDNIAIFDCFSFIEYLTIFKHSFWWLLFGVVDGAYGVAAVFEPGHQTGKVLVRVVLEEVVCLSHGGGGRRNH